MRNLTLWNDNLNTSPWFNLVDLQRNWEKLFEEATTPQEKLFHPACDVEESETHYLMNFDLPGVAKKDIHIEVKENELSITGERKTDRKSNAFAERFQGKFHRVLTLPVDADAQKIEAHYQDGVLSIALAKVEAVKPREIKIGDTKPAAFEKAAEKVSAVNVA